MGAPHHLIIRPPRPTIDRAGRRLRYIKLSLERGVFNLSDGNNHASAPPGVFSSHAAISSQSIAALPTARTGPSSAYPWRRGKHVPGSQQLDPVHVRDEDQRFRRDGVPPQLPQSKDQSLLQAEPADCLGTSSSVITVRFGFEQPFGTNSMIAGFFVTNCAY
jgi:hypothetical protein